jgi:hypothetical protein
VPPTPALDRLLIRARAGEVKHRDPLATLAEEFGLSAPPGGDLPSAALCLLDEAPDLAAKGCWFHADPVHLRPDRDRLLLFGGPSLALTGEEADALVAAFNAHFGSDGLELVAVRPDRWYLRAQTAPNISTQPLYRVSGRPVESWAAVGPGARDWNRWQNEAQMLFAGHPVNQKREAMGRASIGGVWTWGGGVLPRVTRAPALIVSDHPLAVGLARAGGVPVLRPGDLMRQPSAWPEPSPPSALVFWDGLWWPAIGVDARAWSAALGDLEALIVRLSAGVAAGRIRTLVLDDGEAWRFTLTPWGLRRFWRRGGGLRARLRDAPCGQ